MHQSLSSSSLVPFFQQNLTHETKPHHKGPSKTHRESFDPKDGEETGPFAKTPAMTANNARFTGGTLTWEPTFQCYLCFGEGLKAHVKPSRPGGKKHTSVDHPSPGRRSFKFSHTSVCTDQMERSLCWAWSIFPGLYAIQKPEKCQGPASHQRNSKHFPLPGYLGLAYPPSSSSIPPSMQALKRRLPIVAQECCTSCDSPLVTPYLSLSPDKNPPMTSCSFLFILLFAFETSLSSWDPRRDL